MPGCRCSLRNASCDAPGVQHHPRAGRPAFLGHAHSHWVNWRDPKEWPTSSLLTRVGNMKRRVQDLVTVTWEKGVLHSSFSISNTEASLFLFSFVICVWKERHSTNTCLSRLHWSLKCLPWMKIQCRRSDSTGRQLSHTANSWEGDPRSQRDQQLLSSSQPPEKYVVASCPSWGRREVWALTFFQTDPFQTVTGPLSESSREQRLLWALRTRSNTTENTTEKSHCLNSFLKASCLVTMGLVMAFFFSSFNFLRQGAYENVILAQSQHRDKNCKSHNEGLCSTRNQTPIYTWMYQSPFRSRCKEI